MDGALQSVGRAVVEEQKKAVDEKGVRFAFRWDLNRAESFSSRRDVLELLNCTVLLRCH